jgi:hydrogenase maturation factor
MCPGIPGEVIEFLLDQPDLARVDVRGPARKHDGRGGRRCTS